MLELIFIIVLISALAPEAKKSRQRRRQFTDSGAAVYMPPRPQYKPAEPANAEENKNFLKMLAGGAAGVIGALLAGLAGVAALIYAGNEAWMLGMNYVAEYLANIGVFALLGAGFWTVSRLGFKLLDRTKRYRLYKAIIGDKDCVPLSDLARASGQGETALKRDFKDMIRRGYFPQGFIDTKTNCFYASNDAWRAAPKPEPAPEPEPVIQEEPAPAGELQATGRQFLQELDAQADKVDNSAVQGKLNSIRRRTEAIFNWLAAHPSAADDVRRFCNYYLPTTLKLVRSYNEVDPHAESSEAAAEVQAQVAGVLDTVDEAFGNLLDHLIANTAVDVSAEISALETVLTQDGLTRDEMMMKAPLD